MVVSLTELQRETVPRSIDSGLQMIDALTTPSPSIGIWTCPDVLNEKRNIAEIVVSLVGLNLHGTLADAPGSRMIGKLPTIVISEGRPTLVCEIVIVSQDIFLNTICVSR